LYKLDLLIETLSVELEGIFSDGIAMNGNLFLEYYKDSEELFGKYTPGTDTLIPIDTAYSKFYSPEIYQDYSLSLIRLDDPSIGYQLYIVSCEMTDTYPETKTVTGIISKSQTIQAANTISITASI
jgi:hypothetical protein